MGSKKGKGNRNEMKCHWNAKNLDSKKGRKTSEDGRRKGGKAVERNVQTWKKVKRRRKKMDGKEK